MNLYYMGINQLDSAEYFFKKQLPYGYSFDGYRGLMEIAHRRGDATSILNYYKQYEASFDTLVTNIHEEATRQVVGMYDYTRHQKIAMEKEEEARHNKMMLGILVVLILVVTSVFSYWHRFYKKKKLAEILLLNERLSAVSVSYKQVEEDLKAMDTDFEAFRQKKQVELADLKKELTELQTQLGQEREKDGIEMVTQSPIIKNFREKLQPTREASPVAKDDWETLDEVLRQFMPLFHARMTENHALSLLEERVTILTKLGFHSKEIGILLDLSKQHISNLRASANEKLFSDSSARTFLKNLERI